MKTVVLGPRPSEIEELINRRRRLGLDTYDEVWEGSYHMAPAPHSDHGRLDTELALLLVPLAKAVGMGVWGPLNIGGPEDYRVPDRAVLRADPHATFVPTAAVVVEIVSPDDETYDKLPFYATHGVDEVWVVDRQQQRVDIFALEGDRYAAVQGSALLRTSGEELVRLIAW